MGEAMRAWSLKLGTARPGRPAPGARAEPDSELFSAANTSQSPPAWLAVRARILLSRRAAAAEPGCAAAPSPPPF